MKKMLSALIISILFLSACTENEPASESSRIQTTAPKVTITASTESKLPPEPEPEPEELYDTAPISQAYLSADPAGLNEMQSAILEKAKAVIAEAITDDMSDYDKELAIHDWLVRNVTYDEENLNAISAPSEHNRDPYGALFEGRCICAGYATTFQMFMDMLGISCQTIHSTAHDGEEHAWNMVCLDDKWYHVDVTWDDPVPDKTNRPVRHTYFNVTDKLMLEEHNWNTVDVPTANSYEYSYTVHSCRELESLEELPDYIKELSQNMRRDGSFRVKGLSIEDEPKKTVFPSSFNKNDKSELMNMLTDALSGLSHEELEFLKITVTEVEGEKYLLIYGVNA